MGYYVLKPSRQRDLVAVLVDWVEDPADIKYRLLVCHQIAVGLFGTPSKCGVGSRRASGSRVPFRRGKVWIAQNCGVPLVADPPLLNNAFHASRASEVAEEVATSGSVSVIGWGHLWVIFSIFRPDRALFAGRRLSIEPMADAALNMHLRVVMTSVWTKACVSPWVQSNQARGDTHRERCRHSVIEIMYDLGK
ncbi:MAG: hypothetical protein Q9191_000606 [Dirinaria sp. TL-2023a]